MGHYVVLEKTQNLHYEWGYNINNFQKWINKLFSEENKVPRMLFEAKLVAGSATYEQRETVWNFVAL